eukprot:CAMPEP_0114225654 /NCGR_PEP_ID=MMETSP0058-20121206/793_1 /TAXON_ID=36894 /ORGANISM="Pyramimonas parkeae, CCMP726" /LENGTH=260 /DNA_ID=CAMNT_0001336285 /DNA_START=327 /DNA_END=1109 /DNA_ORIENTATION=-
MLPDVTQVESDLQLKLRGLAAAADDLRMPCVECGCEQLYTRDSGQTFHCAECSTCSSSNNCNDMERQVLSLLRAIQEEHEPTPCEQEWVLLSHGVSVAWLKKFLNEHGYDERGNQLTTREVVRRTVLQETRLTRAPLTTHLPPRAVSQAQVFVSHCWGSPFAHTVAAISHALPDHAFVWMDAFALPQWPRPHRGEREPLLESDFLIRNTRALLFVAAHTPSVHDTSHRCPGGADHLPPDALQVQQRNMVDLDASRLGLCW